jgi:hypothetical protein
VVEEQAYFSKLTEFVKDRIEGPSSEKHERADPIEKRPRRSKQ